MKPGTGRRTTTNNTRVRQGSQATTIREEPHASQNVRSLVAGVTHATEPFSPARIALYFSPNGGATEAIVRERNAAQSQVVMQAYSFTSAPIAKALRSIYILLYQIKVVQIIENSPFLVLRATAGSNAAYKIISACSNAVS
jgi:hypothetical protein